ncbi:MAG: glutamate--tRNA ligase [Bacteroidetes bacterium]|nr:glutamate--tRNA ligase [Bacteroidota bacterium]
MKDNIRVRFAPSPTGGLHLGGVRTALYNYLFAKQHGGSFVLRIEDTDQGRYVEGAEQYIADTLAWCGIEPDESPWNPGEFGPYRQSERKNIYAGYAQKLIDEGYAYYAFDTAEDLESLRKSQPNFQYNQAHRNNLCNSLTLPESEVKSLLNTNTPYVIRIKMPDDETISFTDMIRGDVHFNSSLSDDKVLLKADGMPTYHLAVVVDDFLMEITHTFRGEEWLPSTPIHILLWKYLFGLHLMPKWAHLPLILKPEGNGKLSKRAAEKLGFPIFSMNWTDPRSREFTEGFRERGFLPEAFINMLAMLGWNDGTAQEIFSLSELVEKFSIERVHKAGAKFDYEKAKWYNHEWIKKTDIIHLFPRIQTIFQNKGVAIKDDENTYQIFNLVKDRCTLLTDFFEQSIFFFEKPGNTGIESIRPKWNDQKNSFFTEMIRNYTSLTTWKVDILENAFKDVAAANGIKPGELMLPFRIMLVGGKSGPGIFHIAELLGKEETLARIQSSLKNLQ